MQEHISALYNDAKYRDSAPLKYALFSCFLVIHIYLLVYL